MLIIHHILDMDLENQREQKGFTLCSRVSLNGGRGWKEVEKNRCS